MKGARSDVWAKHCGRDLTAVVIHFSSKEGIERKVVACSAYFPSDAKEAPPPQEIKDRIGDCEAERLDLVIGCDANSHHTVGTTKLGIFNVGCEPTFKNLVRKEVLDLSLASGSEKSKIRSWRVSDEISMSDHHHITFELTDVKQEIKLGRNPQKTGLDWVRGGVYGKN